MGIELTPELRAAFARAGRKMKQALREGRGHIKYLDRESARRGREWMNSPDPEEGQSSGAMPEEELGQAEPGQNE